MKGLSKIKKNVKTIQKPPKLVSQSLSKQFQQIPNIFFCFLLKS